MTLTRDPPRIREKYELMCVIWNIIMTESTLPFELAIDSLVELEVIYGLNTLLCRSIYTWKR